MVRRSSVKFNRDSLFPCNKCDFACKNSASLKRHKENENMISLNLSQKQIGTKQSTGNNSLVEGLMLENLSSTGLDKDIATLEEN